MTKISYWTWFFLLIAGSIGSLTIGKEEAPGHPFDSSSTEYEVWAPKLVHDAIMPSGDEVQILSDWLESACTGKEFGSISDGFHLKVVRQDYNILRYDESCSGTPLRIGSQRFQEGLGTHANSVLEFTFDKPIAHFSSKVGIDNNFSTNGTAGSVEFVVLADGQELIRTPKRTGSDEPFEINIDLPETQQLTLMVETTSDGPACDQSDWAEPQVTCSDGTVYKLNKVTDLPLETKIPFSFTYGGVSSEDFLAEWPREVKQLDELHEIISWLDPKTGLKVSLKIRKFADFAALDWVLLFENTSDVATPLIENVQAANLNYNGCVDITPVALHTLTGDWCNENSWLPTHTTLNSGEKKTFSPTGGRSSNGAFPFWNFQPHTKVDDATRSSGIFVAIGWSGQWLADFHRTSPNTFNFKIGQETLSTVLNPGESIRTPRVLIMPWKNDRLSAHALFRRLLLFEYVPKRPDNLPQDLYVVGQCFDRYYRKRPGWEKIEGQIEYAQKLKDAGCNAHWFDAAWFPKGFPNGVGNWTSDPESFPNGVGELGKAIHDRGMKFVLWFEPERVAVDSEIANHHSEYVHGGKEGGLYKLDDPEARKYLGDLLTGLIKDFGVDVYRNDFNIDPLPYWKANDKEPNRQGITEIRYVEGHYEMWDRFRREFPGLWIDNCASGGRRIDLETISRSVPLWRSDTCCWPGHPEWDQTQTLGLAEYIPLYSCTAWDPSPYTFRSAANPGVLTQFDLFNDRYDETLADEVHDAITEGKVYQKFWYGDFYPLTDVAIGQKFLVAWQLHRSDLEAGLVYIFRQTDSPYLGCELSLRALDSESQYRVTLKSDYSAGQSMQMSGAELLAYPILLKNKKTALVLEYERIK